MKSGDKETLGFVRNLHASVRKKEIDTKTELSDAEIIQIVNTSIKQRQDSIDQFKKGGRDDLVASEEAELKFLQQFQPPQMGDEELKKMIADAKEEAQAQADKMITQAQEAIVTEKKVAMAELKSHVAGLSLEIAEKVVGQELSNKDKQLQLVESMLNDAKLN